MAPLLARIVGVCACILVAISPSGLAHQDTEIRLEGTRLLGLPEQYSPAELDLQTFRLRIANHVMDFTPWLSSFFRRQRYDLQISASWYHHDDTGTLPPYLGLHITPKGRDYSYTLLFALDTLRLIEVAVDLRGFDPTPEAWPNSQHLAIAPSEFYRKQIDDSIKELPK